MGDSHAIVFTDRAGIALLLCNVAEQAPLPFRMARVEPTFDGLKRGEDVISTAGFAVVDLLPPSARSIELCQALHARCPELPIVAFSCCPSALTAQQLGLLAASGTVGLLDLGLGTRSIARALTEAANGNGVFRLNTHSLRAFLRSSDQSRSAVGLITGEERAVLGHLARGLSERQIAEEEHLSRRSVSCVIRTLEQKLGAQSLFQLGTLAGQLGLVD